MSAEDIQRMYVRTPKPESKTSLRVDRLWWAYDKDGNNRGQVRLTNSSKKRYEDMGFTFKAVRK